MEPVLDNDSCLCTNCGTTFKKRSTLLRHRTTCQSHPVDPLPQKRLKIADIRCTECQEIFTSNITRDQHAIDVHNASYMNIYSQYLADHLTNDEAAMISISKSVRTIMRPNVLSSQMNKINFYDFDTLSHEIIDKQLNQLYALHDHPFKVNIAFGFLLRHSETDKTRYFYPEKNALLFTNAYSIQNYEDIIKLNKKMQNMDVIEHAQLQRPDTKHRVIAITNVVYFTYSMQDFLLGAVENDLPEYIKKKTSIITLFSNNRGQPYKYNVCMFRALAFHRNGYEKLERHTKSLFAKWYSIHSIPDTDFKGVSLGEIPLFEETFEINVVIFDLEPDDTVRSIYKSLSTFPSTIYLNKHDQHISYINKIKTYSKTFKCDNCGKLFETHNIHDTHQRLHCTAVSRHIYPGGNYEMSKTILEKLCQYGITIQKEDRFYNMFAVYDFECLLKKENQHIGDCTDIISDHVPVSVSIHDNFTGEEPECHVSQDVDELLSAMHCSLRRRQRVSASIMIRKYKRVLDVLQSYIEYTNEDDVCWLIYIVILIYI